MPATLPCILAVSALSLPLQAQGLSPSALAPDRVEFAPTAAILEGEAREFVYYRDQRLSELDWDMKPLRLYGAELSLLWDRGPAVTLGGSAALPGKTGSMQDYDWLNLLTDGSGDLTHYSKSGADLAFAYTARAEIGWRFLLKTPLPSSGSTGRRASVTLTGGFRYMTWSWDGNGGYLQHADPSTAPSNPDGTYKIWSEDVTKVPIAGTAISYLQEYWMPEAGISLSVPAASRGWIEVALRGSPWAWANGVDRHYIPVFGTDYTGSESWKLYFDRLSGGFLFEPALSAGFALTDRLSLAGRWKRTIVGNLRGNTYSKSSASDAVSVSYASSGNGGGAELDVNELSLSLTFRLR